MAGDFVDVRRFEDCQERARADAKRMEIRVDGVEERMDAQFKEIKDDVKSLVKAIERGKGVAYAINFLLTFLGASGAIGIFQLFARMKEGGN